MRDLAATDLPDEYLTIGTLGAPHGVRGEMKLFPLSDVSQRFERLKRVWWQGVGRRAAWEPLQIASLRSVQNGFLVRFEGFDSPEAARTLTNGYLGIPAAQRGPLTAGRYFIDQIIGIQVQNDQGEVLGQVREIYQTRANDVYVVKGPLGELLVPALKSVVRSVDLDAGCLTVHLPEGLTWEKPGH